MATTSSIDIQGLLQNSHNSGVSTSDALFEKIDDSLSADSTEFHWNLSQKDGLISSDNGHGMNKDKLQQSCRLHSRTTSSGDRHGRFGIGSKNAEWILTNLEGSVTKLSSDGNRISQVTINYPNIMKNEESYEPRAHGIEEESRPIWDKYAVNPSGSGTVTQMEIPSAKYSELIELFANDTVTGLGFKLATTYCDALTRGVKISIQIEDNPPYQIHPIDRLSSSVGTRTQLAPNSRVQFKCESHHIEHVQNTTTGEIVSHVLSSDGTMRTRLDKTHKKLVPISESMDSFVTIGHTKCSLAYSNDWNIIQNGDFEKNGITPLRNKENGIQMFRKNTNGTEIVRNGKMLKHIQSKPITKGDKAAYKYHDNTRARTEFVANDKMDVLYNVQVNKSQVDEDLIDKSLWKTIERLRKTFIDECYKTLEPVQVSASPSPSPSGSVSASVSASASPSISSSPSISVERLPQAASAKSASASKSKLNSKPLVSSAPLASSLANSQSIATSIATSDSESVSDNEEGLVGGGAAAAMEPAVEPADGAAVGAADVPNFVPDSEQQVGASRRQYIVRETGEKILEHWLSSNQHMATLNETHDDLISAYLKVHDWMALNKFRKVLNKMTPVQKHELLIDLIQEEHPLPETRMFKGIELFRTYSEAFGTNAQVHL
jgi:hypothetical protein